MIAKPNILPAQVRAILARHGTGKSPSPELRALILAEPASVSNCAISRRYGLRLELISQVRRAGGIITPGMQRSQNLPGMRGWRGRSDAKSCG